MQWCSGQCLVSETVAPTVLRTGELPVLQNPVPRRELDNSEISPILDLKRMPERSSSAAGGTDPKLRSQLWQLHSESRRRRSALAITETELKLMAAAAIMGLKSRPKNG